MKNQLRTLLVEDNPGDADLIREMLADTIGLNFKIEGVSSLAEAQSQLSKKDFDLILLDLGLPDSPGLDTLRNIRKAAADIPIVVLTGNDDERIGIAAVKEGAQDYLIKGQIPDYLLSRVLFFALERHQINAKVKHLNRILRAIRNINQLIVSEKDRDLLLKKACACLVEDRSYNHAWIVTNDEDGNYDEYYEKNVGADFENFKTFLQSGKIPVCISQAIISESALINHDMRQNCRDCPLVNIYAEYQTASVRLEHDSKIFGVLTVAAAKDNVISSEEIGLLNEAAHDIALALHSIEQSILREKAETEIRHSEEKFRSLFENMLNGFAYCKMIFDETGKPQDWVYLQVNEAFKKITGLTGVTGKRVTEVIPGIKKDTPELIERYGRVASTGHEDSFEIYIDTLKIWFSVMAICPQKGYFVAVFEDITERKQTERALRESEEKHRTYVENAPHGIFITDADGRYTGVNPAACKMLGYSEKELLEMSIPDLLPPGSPPEALESFVQLKQEGSVDIEIPLKRKDGSAINVNLSAVRLSGDRYMAFCADISDRKLAEEALRKSYDLMEHVTRLVPGVVYQYRLYPDGRSSFPWSSQGMNDIYEVTPDDVQEDATPVFGRLHPEDFDFVSEAIFESARTLETFYCEFRVILPRQGLRWRWSQAHPVRTDDGGTLWHGIISDITDRKKAETELKKHRDHLDDLVGERTAELKKTIGLMAGREVRMAGLKDAIRKLRAQIEAAGMIPTADDPMIEGD